MDSTKRTAQPNDAVVAAPLLREEKSLDFEALDKRSESFAARNSHHSHEPSMHNVSLLMRPEDAELLESIHFSTANGCESPFVQAAVRDSHVPSLSLSGFGASTASESDTSEPQVISKHSHYKSPMQKEKKTYGRLSSRNLDEILDSEEHLKRRALSGEVFDRMSTRSIESAELEKIESPIVDAQAITEETLLETPKIHRRTESLTRRINEAQQFAEAVGDLFPNEQDELRIIEDDVQDDTDDEDDDKTVVCVESAEVQPAQQVQVQQPIKDVPVRRKSRPSWPFANATKRGFMDKLPDTGTQQDFVYKGIRANPPIIVKRGTDRGNYAQLHRKAWLEVSDKYHRYGKHLRVYYRHWEKLGCPYNMFFDWLDSKGEAAGQPLPNLEECPRSELDSDTVLYIASDEITAGYALKFEPDENGRGRVSDVDGDPVKTGLDGWIFVLRDNVMYGAQKITSVQGKSKQRFHHSSFFGGKAVAAAGIFVTDDEGFLTRLYPHSGHYRPGEAHMQRMLFFLHHEGVDLRTFEMDMQQILRVARDAPEPSKDGKDGVEKKKKVETLCLVPAVEVACHLAHKARFIGENIFSQIHRIRQSGATTVNEALEAIDDYGH